MAVTGFKTNSETGLDAIAADILAADATFDDAAANNENAQFLTVFYVLVKAIRARQRAAKTTGTGTARDRIGEFVGGHTAMALMNLASMIDEVYNEMFAVANNVDDAADDPWGTDLLTQGSGPAGGPIHG